MPGLFTASNYVLPAGSAKPGDTLEIFATGLGATAAAVAPGLVFSGAYPTTATPTVAVPADLAAGTYPVVVTQAGASSPSTALLKIVTE